ncbi:Lcl C-terminal domain-containing protein [Micromonospora sp. CPCC 206061]|uniref:Lcl C-terminal domain-containing protein n=1 Tax=Micromonospora sp. CPCC 206061 TaxID=3122410 RepID=UPI002FEF4956
MPRAIRDSLPVTIHLLAVMGLALAGCAAQRPAETPHADALVAAETPTVTSSPTADPTAAPTPAKSSPASASVRPGTRKQTTTRSGATAKCGPALSQAWASWPMPNPKGTGLPNAASYTDLGDGSVRDNVTCLVWQKAYSAEKLTWSSAKSYCAGLSIGDSGWRLPSRIELTSIMDFTRSGPAIDTTAFKGLANFFWTGSPWAVAHDPPYAWVMNFYEGLASNAGNTTATYHARCVRAATGTGAATYTTVAAGEVRDDHTGLIWQRATSATTMSATAAASYCAALALGGHAWRLPSIKELATTVDESRVAPAINPSVFPNTAKKTYYWSASKSHPQPDKTWGLSYDDGYTNYRNIPQGYARCVR